MNSPLSNEDKGRSVARIVEEPAIEKIDRFIMDKLIKYPPKVEEPEEKNREMITGHPDRNWTEDLSYENGNYINLCGGCQKYFQGHKRRVRCKQCQTVPDSEVEDHESQSELFRQVVELFNHQHKLYGRPDYQLLKERFSITRIKQ